MNRDDDALSPRAQATAFSVLLQDCDEEADWVAHPKWLKANSANTSAYEAVEMLWVETDGLQKLKETARTEPVFDLADYRAQRRRTFLRWAPTAAVAG